MKAKGWEPGGVGVGVGVGVGARVGCGRRWLRGQAEFPLVARDCYDNLLLMCRDTSSRNNGRATGKNERDAVGN